MLLNEQLGELRADIQALKTEIKASNDTFQESIDKATQEKLQGEERGLQSRRTKVYFTPHVYDFVSLMLLLCRRKIVVKLKV